MIPNEGFRFLIYILVTVCAHMLFIHVPERNIHLQEFQEVIQEINDTCKLFQFGNISMCLKAFIENTNVFKKKYLNEIKRIDQDMDELKQNQNEKESKIFQKITKLELNITEFGKKQSDMSLQIAGMGGRQEYMEKQLYSPDSLYFMILIAVVIILLMIMYRFCRGHENRKVEKTQIDNYRRVKREEHSSILENINRRDLENTITVVSFNDGERQKMHRKLTESIADHTYSIKTVYIKTKEDILLMNSKVSFVFVDKNDRNIILESKYEIGQHLKSLTVQAILNMGGKPVVIYFLHDGSSELHTQDLYSPALTSIKAHEWLSKLEKEGCVLSVFTDFTKFQRDHLTQKLEEYLS